MTLSRDPAKTQKRRSLSRKEKISLSDEDQELNKFAYRYLGRWRKVAHLLAALYIHEIPPEIAVKLKAEDLNTVAKVAGISAPSAHTILLLKETISKIPSNS